MDYLIDYLRDLVIWLIITALCSAGLLIRLIFTNKSQIDLLKEEIKYRIAAKDRSDEDIKSTLLRLECGIDTLKAEILELWKNSRQDLK